MVPMSLLNARSAYELAHRRLQSTHDAAEMPPKSPRNACALLGRLVFAKMMFSKKASATLVPSRPPSACILPGHRWYP